MDIQRIERMKIRDVWAHEAHDFTTWLEENIDILDDDLIYGLDPDSVRREASAGAFSVDLVADDINGATVIIENQLGRSDHDHLGKVLTYASMFDAEIAIWIVGDPRSEHVKAVTWLNDSSQLTAYMFKLEAIKIGDSPVAPLLTLIVGPPDAGKQIASSKQEKSERHHARRAFYTALLDHATPLTKLHSGRSPVDGPFLGGSTGSAGIGVNYGVTQHGTAVYLWIERGKEWVEWNDAVYRSLKEHQEEIENSFGGPITWDAKEANRSRKLIGSLQLGGWVDNEKWDQVIPATVETMIRFEAAIRPHLKNAAQAADKAVPSPSVDV
jgi:hypothetical protein